MTDRNEFDLLVEIAKLVRKYGPETFERLATQISKPEFAQRLSDIVLVMATSSRTAQKNKGQLAVKQPQGNFRSELIELKKSDEEKGELLLRLYDCLMEKTLLPTLRDMKAFASDNGLPLPKATARDKAIIPLIKALLTLPLGELKTRLQRLRPSSDSNDRGLEGWSNIILGKQRP